MNRLSLGLLFCLLAPRSYAGGEEVARRRAAKATTYAEICVLDADTGRGVPLAELETVNGLTFITDNAGRIAFHEPGLMDREVFFTVRSHGYEVKNDGFGIAGAKITPRAGAIAQIKIARRNVAERLCRLTGEGLYRDSVLLGYQVPLRDPLNPGKVGGQDSVQAAIYRGKVYWFWGDTLRMDYPLGLFRTAGATTPTFDPNDRKSDPAAGIAFDYFADPKSGFTRAMMPLAERPEGVVWIAALAVVPDDRGNEKLVAHYSRRKGLEKELEQGIAVFDDERAIFTPAKQLSLDEKWRRPSGHPILFEEEGTKWLLFGSPTPNVRVRATLRDLLNTDAYEAFTCLKQGGDAHEPEPEIGENGAPVWRWQKTLSPLDSKTESQLVKSGKIEPRYARFYPSDAAQPEDRVVLHSGSVRFNEYRKRWVLLAGQIGGKASFLGEVWYAESDHPTGPFTTAVRVATHDRQTFYNVCHHAFLDRDDGRTIHFEGTYTNDFSGNPVKTARYNYNQVLYRLDLSSPALLSAHATGNGRHVVDAGRASPIETGLAWLARNQRKDGSWSLTGPYGSGALRRDVPEAATAMALLAFLGAGNTPERGNYKEQMSAGIKALLKFQGTNGNCYQAGPSNNWFYVQGQCTLAVCELYGMTKDPALKKRAELAIQFCIDSQDPELGGWKYMPRSSSDTSVTGWIMMALQSARMAGLEVPRRVLERVSGYLDKVSADGSRYSYEVSFEPTLAMTATALLCRQHLGWKLDDPRLLRGGDILMQNLPRYEDRDVYYWYYGTQVMHRMQGKYWAAWNGVLRDLLIENQEKAGVEKGSWDPLGEHPDRWANLGQGGRLYTTCLSLLMLESGLPQPLPTGRNDQ